VVCRSQKKGAVEIHHGDAEARRISDMRSRTSAAGNGSIDWMNWIHRLSFAAERPHVGILLIQFIRSLPSRPPAMWGKPTEIHRTPCRFPIAAYFTDTHNIDGPGIGAADRVTVPRDFTNIGLPP
jgi:hypothetical protein